MSLTKIKHYFGDLKHQDCILKVKILGDISGLNILKHYYNHSINSDFISNKIEEEAYYVDFLTRQSGSRP